MDGAWWMVAPFALLLLLGVFLLRYNFLMGVGLLVLLFAPFAIDHIKNRQSVSALSVTGHLRPDDPTTLVAFRLRETPEFYATLLYGGGFEVVYDLPKTSGPPFRYPFDTPSTPTGFEGTRYTKSNSAGCERYTFKDYPSMRQSKSTDTYRCLAMSKGRFDLELVGSDAIVFSAGATRKSADARETGLGLEVRRRRNARDELIAFSYATGTAQTEPLDFLKRALARR